MNVSSRLFAGASVLPLLVASAALAQTQGTAPPAATVSADIPANSTAISEVVVTARHRSENLQEVPISVSVVSGAQAAAQNLNDLGDISQIVPAIDFRTGASNKDRTIFIRGIGTISTSPGVEPSVSTVIDGVVLARPGMATLDLLDLDHIEVLQGPQGTLFGKNASAGVVNIVTANPTATPHAYVDGSYFEGSEYRIKAGVSGPIVGDKLEGLVSVFTAQYRGNVENIYSGVDKEDNGYRHTGARAKFIARPVDNLTLTLGADYTNSADTTPTGVYASTNRIAYPSGVLTPNANLANALAASGINPYPDNRTISTNTNSSVHDKNGGVSLQADWTVFGDYTITSISAYRKWRNVQYQDYDMQGVPVGPAGGNFAQGVDTGHVDFDQESQELRIASPKGRFIDYVAGFYYLHAADTETYERDITQINAAGATVLNNGVAHYGTTGDNYALFGEANINFTKQFRAIAGYREIWDNLSYYHNRGLELGDGAAGGGDQRRQRSVFGQPLRLRRPLRPAVRRHAGHHRLRDLFAGLQGAGLQRLLQHEPGKHGAARVRNLERLRGGGEEQLLRAPPDGRRRRLHHQLLELSGQFRVDHRGRGGDQSDQRRHGFHQGRVGGPDRAPDPAADAGSQHDLRRRLCRRVQLPAGRADQLQHQRPAPALRAALQDALRR